MTEPTPIDYGLHISGWRVFWALLVTVAFGWLAQVFVLLSTELIAFTWKSPNIPLSLAVFVGYPIASYLFISFTVGLIYAYFWTDTQRPRDAIQSEIFSLWALVVVPTALATCFISVAIYFLTVLVCRAGLNWGLDNWPKKPWEVWLGQRPPEVPAPRHHD